MDLLFNLVTVIRYIYYVQVLLLFLCLRMLDHISWLAVFSTFLGYFLQTQYAPLLQTRFMASASSGPKLHNSKSSQQTTKCAIVHSDRCHVTGASCLSSASSCTIPSYSVQGHGCFPLEEENNNSFSLVGGRTIFVLLLWKRCIFSLPSRLVFKTIPHSLAWKFKQVH